jgi:hypothetical protein
MCRQGAEMGDRDIDHAAVELLGGGPTATSRRMARMLMKINHFREALHEKLAWVSASAIDDFEAEAARAGAALF